MLPRIESRDEPRAQIRSRAATQQQDSLQPTGCESSYDQMTAHHLDRVRDECRPQRKLIRRQFGDRRQLSIALHLAHARELSGHVGFDLGDHRLELGFGVQRFQNRILFE